MSKSKKIGTMTPDELEYLQTHEMSRRDFWTAWQSAGSLHRSVLRPRCRLGLESSLRTMRWFE